ncbi:MAG: glycosyltransferase family A protein [Thermoplasmatales archaeon]
MSEISVIVPVYNGVDNGLYKCLKSVLSQSYQNLELIIIEDGSRDSSNEVIDQISNPLCKKIVHTSNKGLAASLNDGIRSASGSYLMIIQQDCSLLSKDVIRKSLEFMSLNKDIDILVGRQIYDFNKLNFYQKFAEFSLDHLSLNIRTQGEVDLTENKCDIIRKNAMDTIGFFDTTQRISGEDQIFSNRALSLGFKLYIGNHLKYFNHLLGEDTLTKILRKHFRYGRYSWNLYKKMYRNRPKGSSKKSYAFGKIQNRILSVSFSSAIFIFFVLSLTTLNYGFFSLIVLIILLRVLIAYKKLISLKKSVVIPRFPSLLASGLIVLTDIAFTLGFVQGVLSQA